MMLLPPDIRFAYRLATDADVKAWSFGLVKAAKINAGNDWQKQRGTFDDQAIFGPKRRFRCACGKLDGDRFKDKICDRCGVKVASPEVRHRRSAHIDLSQPIAHPLGKDKDRLNVLPVLPVAFIDAPDGSRLLDAYDQILRGQGALDFEHGFVRLLEILAPLLVTAHQWDLRERSVIAHGMGLKDQEADRGPEPLATRGRSR